MPSPGLREAWQLGVSLDVTACSESGDGSSQNRVQCWGLEDVVGPRKEQEWLRGQETWGSQTGQGCQGGAQSLQHTLLPGLALSQGGYWGAPVTSEETVSLDCGRKAQAEWDPVQVKRGLQCMRT